MALRSYDNFIKRIADGFSLQQPIFGEVVAATSVLTANTVMTMQRAGYSKQLPTPFPTGVTNYIISRVSVSSATTTISCLVAAIIDLGSLSLATPTFTDGVAMPTVTELGVSRQIASAVLCEVTTVLNATPGSITITYVDQDGHSSETTTATALTASAAVRSVGWIPLNTGDWGVTDITAANRTGGTTPTGVLQFWGIIPIYLGPATLVSSQTFTKINLLSEAINPVRLAAGSKIALFTVRNTVVNTVLGDIFAVGDN